MNHAILARSFVLFCGVSMLIGCQGAEAESDLADDDAAAALAAKDWTPPKLSNPNAVSLNPDALPPGQSAKGAPQTAAASANWYADAWLIGGSGGASGQTQNWNAGPIKTLEVWAGGSSLRGIKITHWDGTQYSLGQLTDQHSSFTFNPGETVTSCSLWGNGAGTRHGGFRLRTSQGREYFPHMYSWGLKTEYPVPVGSGFMVGANWRAGNDIDAFGFVFVNDVSRVAITNMNYGNAAKGESPGQPQVLAVGKTDFKNTTSAPATYQLSATQTFTATDSFTNEFGISVGAEFGFEGGVPLIGASSAKVTLNTSYKFSKTHSSSSTIGLGWSVTPTCPPRTWCFGTAALSTWSKDLAYTGTMKYYLTNGLTYWHPIRGAYYGALNGTLSAVAQNKPL